MTSIQIYIKLLSGDMFPLEVGYPISLSELYDVVYHALPKDIQPKKVYQLQLLLPQESEVEEEKEEKAEKKEMGDIMLDLKENDVIPILLSDTTYELSLEYICDAQDMDRNETYERYRLEIVSGRDIVYTKHFYTTHFADQYVGQVICDIFPILPSMEIHPDGELEHFRSCSCISRDDLLADFHYYPILRKHLLVLLKRAWKSEQRYTEYGYDEDDSYDEDED